MKTAQGLFGLVIVFALLLVQQMAWAQGQGRGMMMSPQERAQQLKERIALTDEQTAKVAKILEESQTKMMEMMGSFQGDREAARKAMQEVQAKQDKAIEALLTKDQLKKYEELKKERMQRMQQRRQGEQ
jgi:Spy/CpxP family protein refolding chaperone